MISLAAWFALQAPAHAQNVGLVTLGGVSTGCIFPDVGSALQDPLFGYGTTIYVASDATVTEPVAWGLVPTEFYVRGSTLALGCGSSGAAWDLAVIEWTGQTESLVELDGTIFSVADVAFTQGAMPSGGAPSGYFVNAKGGARVNLERTEFSGGRALDGGALYLDDSHLTANFSTFDDNVAEQSGGAVYLRSSTGVHTAHFGGSTFTHNSAGNLGGAMAVFDLNLGVTDLFDFDALVRRNPLLSDNNADHGGALYVELDQATETLDIRLATFERNTADLFDTGAGGALRTVVLDDADMSIVDSTFTANEAFFGAGWAHTGGELVTAAVSGGSWGGNLAEHEGGALHLDGGITVDAVEVRFVENIVTGTGPTDIGGLALVDGSTLNLTNVLAPGNSNVSGIAGAVSIRDGGHSTTLHTTLGGASSFGFGVDGTSSLTLQGSIVWGNGIGAIAQAALATVVVQCSNTDGGVLPGPLNTSAPPLFVAPGVDFHLTAATPLAIRQACPPQGAVPTDLDGVSRTASTSMGAFELD
ncbi:MAG: hypothetical protein KTR31_41905 [Myxococcales bacterium]|nr:hypothetical protein [Myxococcales bacterium]